MQGKTVPKENHYHYFSIIKITYNISEDTYWFTGHFEKQAKLRGLVYHHCKDYVSSSHQTTVPQFVEQLDSLLLGDSCKGSIKWLDQ